MNQGRTVFSQLMDFIPSSQFRKCVKRYNGNYKVKHFSCWNQFLCMAFAQLTYREGLRDIEACLRAVSHKLYHLGIRGTVSRNTLSNANRVRDWRIYRDFAHILIGEARTLYSDEPLAVELDTTVYALDSTTIDLCLSLFPWAVFRKHKGAVKLHTLLDLRGNIPTICILTDGKVHDVNILDQLLFEPGTFYIMDRGYLDFSRLHKMQSANAFFVIRAKRNLRCRRIYSNPVNKETGVQVDQIIRLTGFYSKKEYPDKLRKIHYLDREQNKELVFLSNNMTLTAETIAQLYKSRWQIELFFKWIKQHLRIKKFYGNNENAVKSQIWIAISMYVTVAIMKKRLKLKQDLYILLQILSVTLFERMPILQALTSNDYNLDKEQSTNQLKLFE